MARYVTRAHYDEFVGCDVNYPSPHEVHEADGLVRTGLLDQSGQPIYRTDKGKLGFDLTVKPRYRVKAISGPR